MHVDIRLMGLKNQSTSYLATIKFSYGCKNLLPFTRSFNTKFTEISVSKCKECFHINLNNDITDVLQ